MRRGRPINWRAGDRPPRSTQDDDAVFRYHLLDIAGRDVDVIERDVPLRTDDTIIVDTGEAWRIVTVLGTSATVARA